MPPDSAQKPDAKTEPDRVFLTRQADALMPPGEYVHTLLQSRGSGLLFVGADRLRSDILAWADLGQVELAGEIATKMDHGIAAHDAGRTYFVATKLVAE